MNSIGVSGVLAAFLLLGTTVKGNTAGVSFWKTTFTMTCPGEGTWYNGETDLEKEGESLTLEYNNKQKGLYNCKYTTEDVEKMYKFFVKGKVCENCFELDGIVVVVGVIVDLLVTGAVILLVYRWAKRNKSAATTPTTKARPHAEGRAGQPVQPSHYEKLNHHTRSPDTYSTVNRMG